MAQLRKVEMVESNESPREVAPVSFIPQQGRAHDELIAELSALGKDDADWRGGKVWSLVYHASDAHTDLLKKAATTFFCENGLNPMAFKSLKRMEHEVVQMAKHLMHGGDDGVGTMTTGGTESLLLALKTYRDWAKKTKPWITKPEIVIPATAHVAFDKGAHYFGLKIRYAPIGKDFRVDVKALKRLINKNTIMIAGSAPQYPHGVVDPIAELSAIALEKGLGLHVDACVGGFMLPFVEKLGHHVPSWDFRLPGVTSISADLHKYGYTAKGASVVLYKSMDYMRHQFFISTNWPGGIYASPTIPGTRAAGPIAAAWTGLQAMGEAGYLDLTKRALAAAARLKEGINAIDGVKVIGSEHCTIVTWASDSKDVDVYAVADQLEDRGWMVDRQQHPACVHCTVMANHGDSVDAYVKDLSDAVAFVKANSDVKARGNAAMYGMMAKVPVRAMVKQGVMRVMEAMYGKTGEVDLQASQGDGVVDRLDADNPATVMRVLDKVDDVAGPVIRRLKQRRGSR